MDFDFKFWLRFSLFNLLLVASLGVLMRYKIGFEFPFFDQHNILHAHSHFAFAGWITNTLFVLMIRYLLLIGVTKSVVSYNRIIISNLICSYGILISFAVQGYGVVSIIFSTLSVVIMGIFAYYFLNDLEKLPKKNPVKAWFKSAIWFGILSSIGTFYLAFMMVTKHFNESWYLASVYFYLHFQYNGFFIFTIIGLLYSLFQFKNPSLKHDKRVFDFFFYALIPAYFLSTLWADLPSWLYVMVVIAAFMQTIGGYFLFKTIRKQLLFFADTDALSKRVLLFVGIAFLIKLMLQLGSTVPVVSNLAFGFRPVVIAYLHLVLLAVISVFLIGFLRFSNLIQRNKTSDIGVILFMIGVFLNEFVLAIQGVAAFSYLPVPFINTVLFCIALLILFSIILIVKAQLSKKVF